MSNSQFRAWINRDDSGFNRILSARETIGCVLMTIPAFIVIVLEAMNSQGGLAYWLSIIILAVIVGIGASLVSDKNPEALVDQEKFRKSLISLPMIFVSLLLGYLSTLTGPLVIKATLALLSGTGIGVFMCLAMNVPLKRIRIIVGSSLTVFCLVVIYAQFSRRLLF